MPTCHAFVTRIEHLGIIEADEFSDERTEDRNEDSLGSFEGTFEEVAKQVVAAVPTGLVWTLVPGSSSVRAPEIGNFRIVVEAYLTFGDFDLPEIEEMNAPIQVVANALMESSS